MPASIEELYKRIAAVTTKYTFTSPVEPCDVETVQKELAAALAGDAQVTMKLGVDVVVTVDGKRIYQRLMLVQEPPR